MVQESKYGHVYTYGLGLKRLLVHTYVQASSTWLGQNGETASSRVHGEPTGWVGTKCVVVFIGSQPAWMEQPMETRPSVPQNGGNGLVFDRPRSKRDHFQWEGSGIPQYGGNRLLLDVLRSKRGPVDREGCGVPQNGGNGLVLERYSRNGVLFIRRGVAYRKTELHGIMFISTVNLLQSPWATVHPLSTSSSLHLRLFIHGLLFIQPPPLLHWLLFNHPSPRGPVKSPLHGLLFIQPSTSYCSTSPPRATVQPALHGVLFIQPSTGSYSSSPSRGPVHPPPTSSIDWGPVHPEATPRGPVHPTPHRELFIQIPPTTLTVHQGKEAAGSIGFS